MKTITVQLEDNSYEFLKKLSFERTGKSNISSAIRILINEKKGKKL